MLLREHPRHGLDGFESLPKPRHALAVPLELAIRQVPDAQVRDPTERRALHLRAHLRLSIVWRHNEQFAGDGGGRAQRQVQQPYDS